MQEGAQASGAFDRLEEFFAEAQETGGNDGFVDQAPGRNDGCIDQTPATPRIQPSNKERRRAKSADGSNIRAAFEDQEEDSISNDSYNLYLPNSSETRRRYKQNDRRQLRPCDWGV